MLDAAGQQRARTYVLELGRGRKATVAKAFDEAEQHFSKSLEALPKDPRALGERGYARLLAGKLKDAEADLTEASRTAPNTALRLQVLHNLALLERKLGDEPRAQLFEKERANAKTARRLPSGVDCSTEVTDSDLELKVVSSFDEVMKLVLAAHAAADSSALSDVAFSNFDEGDGYPQKVKALAAQRPFPDGTLVLWTAGPNSNKNHGVIAQSGKFYVYPNLSSGNYPLCGPEGLADVTFEGGGARPWRIVRSYRELVRGYQCVGGDCNGDGTGGEPPQMMGFCAWSSSSIDATFLDAKTFEGIRKIYADAHPSGDDAAAEPERLLELDWQADKVSVDACGQHRDVPYSGN